MVQQNTLKYLNYSKESVIETLETLNVNAVKNNKKVEYINMPVSFDIETSSFYKGEEKTSIMYIWMVDIYDNTFIGRNWDDFISLCSDISEYYGLHKDKRVIIYVHNLSYEFQFICKRFNWIKVFALDVRKPIYALTDIGLEFRCSYLLSGYSLEKLGTTLINHKIEKLVGNLDYTKIRHKDTELTAEEIAYCINDVKLVTAYILERIELEGDITKIPLTKTGYVRQYCKKACFGSGKNKNQLYRRFISRLTLEPDEYKQLKRAFQGGFTHANPFYSNKVIDNVASFDFTSSYPAVMLTEKFPMSKGVKIDITSVSQFDTLIKSHCCLFNCVFKGLESRYFFDSYISISRAWNVINATVNNGRIVRADQLYITVTEQDFIIIQSMYEWEELLVGDFTYYLKSYLPTEFVLSIIELYKNKTKLKGVTGSEYDYARSKEMINSAYGMIVTDICRDEIGYSKDWEITSPKLDEMIAKYNSSKGRFLYYPWGVWVTAYARRNLFTGIMQCNNDYVYSDTDSIKIINMENHLDYIESYNDMITDKLYLAMMYHDLTLDDVMPENLKGEVKQIGIWEYEGTYRKFKTLGAKRYLTLDDKGYKLTVAGLSKQIGLRYILENSENPFDFFQDEMYIPKGKTGKMTHTYIDETREGKITDYKGIESDYIEYSSIHLEECDYSLKLSHEYADYILGFEDWSI